MKFKADRNSRLAQGEGSALKFVGQSGFRPNLPQGFCLSGPENDRAAPDPPLLFHRPFIPRRPGLHVPYAPLPPRSPPSGPAAATAAMGALVAMVTLGLLCTGPRSSTPSIPFFIVRQGFWVFLAAGLRACWGPGGGAHEGPAFRTVRSPILNDAQPQYSFPSLAKVVGRCLI